MKIEDEDDTKEIITKKIKIKQDPDFSGYECCHCHKTYRTKPHLKRHLHSVHPFNIVKKELADEGLQPFIGYECYHCESRFSRRDNLTAHLKRNHTNTVPIKNYKCEYCGVLLGTKHSLNRHKMYIHSTDEKKVDSKKPRNVVLKCVLCGSSFLQRIQVLQHYEKRHKIKIESERLRFFSETEFCDWKKNIETTMTCHFAKRNSHIYKNHSLTTFTCHRSGLYESKANVRKTKLIGSKKVNGLCPAEIKLHKTKKGTFNVLFVKTHVGHSIGTEEESSHIFYISKQDRHRITTRITADIPLYGRVKSVGVPERGNDSCALHLENGESMQSILSPKISGRQFAFDDVQDFVSRNCASILYYKAEGSRDSNHPFLNEDDGVLIFMNSKQEQMVKRFGSDVIALDTAHKSDERSFILQTLLVIDEYRESYPVAFALSNRNDELLLEMFLSYVKDKVGALKPNMLMTDMEETDYSIWVKIMGKPIRRVYCLWYVQEKWQEDLKMIPSTQKQVSMKMKLYTLATETNVDTFKEKLLQLINDRDGELAPFLSHFEATYLKNVEYWAYCHRILKGMRTNLYVRSFHKYAKYRCGGTAPVTRTMSSGIQIIEKHITRKEVDLMRAESSGKLTMKLSTLKQRHDALEVNKVGDHLNAYIEKTEHPNEWHVGSFVSPNDKIIEIYVVTQVVPTKCENCPLLCEKCDICIHQFQCTCDDSFDKLNMCKHIHALGLFLKYDLQVDPTIAEYEVIKPESSEAVFELATEKTSKFDEVLEDGLVEVKRGESLEKEKREIKLLFQDLLRAATTVEDFRMIREGLKILCTNLDGYSETVPKPVS